MNKLIVVVATSRLGKSTYSQYLSKHKGYGLVCWDDYCKGGTAQAKETQAKALYVALKKSLENKDTVLDGWAGGNVDALRQNVGGNVELRVMLAPVWVHLNRQLEMWGMVFKTEPFDLPEAVYIECSQPLYVELTYEDYKKLKPSYWYENALTKEEVKQWSENPNKSYDGDHGYQAIYLGYGYWIEGGPTSANIKTWRQLKEAVDFKGKTVLDVGCYLGYFSFQAEVMKAKAVVGIDRGWGPLDDALKIKSLRQSSVVFLQRDVEGLDLNLTFDLILCLNMFHHIKDQPAAIANLKRHAGGTIVFEVCPEDVTIIKAGFEDGFDIVSEDNTGRGRKLLIVKKKECA